MRLGRTVAGLVAVGLVLATRGSACAGGDDVPRMDVAKRDYDGGAGNGALIGPANDTRANLLLLLADRGAPLRPATSREIFFSWKDVRERADPAPLSPAAAAVPPPEPDPTDDTRCWTNRDGAADFAAALAAARGLAPVERVALQRARAALKPSCADGWAPAPRVAAQSPAGQSFAGYLAAADSFYGGDFAAADRLFAALGAAADPWVRETAVYMRARNALQIAQVGLFDEYGSIVEPAKRDRAKAAAATRALDAYLAAYPRGRYAESAAGLLRRAAWFSGDETAFATRYASLLDRPADAPTLIEEIDAKLLEPAATNAATGPLLLAAADLKRLRSDDEHKLTRAELDRQRPVFSAALPLYSYLVASEAFWGRSAPAEVLALIPDAAHQRRFTYLEFSRQMLRGMALDRLGDRNAYGFWLSLLPGATAPGQRPLVELAIAQHEERRGSLERMLADRSPVQTPALRQIALAYVAGPELLRARATATSANADERDLALTILLSRELTRGRYADWLRDIALLPPKRPEPADRSYPLPLPLEQEEVEQVSAFPGLDAFRDTSQEAGFACPPLRQTVATLAAPSAPGRAELCLADWLRQSGFDDWAFDRPPAYGYGEASPRDYGTSGVRWPGTPYSRLAVYRRLLARPELAPDDRAYTLYRAVWCFGPSGINSCGSDAAKSERKAWFAELKTRYPQSRWAQDLRYYW